MHTRTLTHTHTHTAQNLIPSPRLYTAGEQTDSVNNKTLDAALLYTEDPAAVH